MMDFDTPIDRRGTHSMKWDLMEDFYGVSPDDGLAMWVADMDFRPPQKVQDALSAMLEHGIYGYFGDTGAYLEAISWWMKSRHDWPVSPDWVFTTHGLVNGVALCLDAYTKPGDGVVIFTPVYHAFAKTIKAAGREVVECEMINENGRYSVDFDACDRQMTGRETMMILCSPHNPGGRVWSQNELQGYADFAKRHNLLLLSDEIHHDLVYPGHSHTPMAKIAGVSERLIMLTATSKTFNIAGGHSGNVIIENPALRARFADRMAALGISANSFGLTMTTAAYSPDGALWVDALVEYLDGNRRLFDEGINGIPGLRSMVLESTYLSWVDFSRLGMSQGDIISRVQNQAKIAANHGATFGKGGENFLRFNIAAPRQTIEDAVERLQNAFRDLQ